MAREETTKSNEMETRPETLESLMARIDPNNVPAHVAIIMDGNGRWAKARGLDRTEGHVEGVNTVRRITEIANDTGVKVLTMYTFSTENWNRPKAEVDSLMHLISIAIERETPDMIKNNVRLSMIGDLDSLPEEPRQRLLGCFKATEHCTGVVLNMAISYSGRWDITEACRRVAAKVAAGQTDPRAIDEDAIAAELSTVRIPSPYKDPDLLLRTGGEHRISNFLLWQIAYSEIIVTDTLWPDFSKEDFCRVILQYQGRERRFGLTSEQISAQQPDR